MSELSSGFVATVIGTSGAWSSIRERLARRGLTVAQPRGIDSLLRSLETGRPEIIAAHHESTKKEVQTRANEIVRLSAETGLLRKFVNWFKIHRLRSEIDCLYTTDAAFPVVIDADIAMVRELLGSAELKGAEAELSVIEKLRKLPEYAVVFNDVQLRADRHIYFDGAALQSAQIDHLVLMPAGVFVIETKYWSRRSVESGVFHDPFDQLRRANYLCYDSLRRAFGKTSVRSVIVNFGYLPDAPPNSYVKVVRPDRLVGYLRRFTDAGMTLEKMASINSFFEVRTPSRGT